MGILEIFQFYLAEYAILRFLLTLLIVFISASTILFLFKKVIQKNLERAHKYLQERIVIRIETPIVLIIVLAGSEIALREILLGTLGLKNVVDSLIVAVIAYIFIQVMDILIDYWEEIHESANHEFVHGEMLPLVRSVGKIIIVLIALVLVLQMWGVEVGALVASVGVLGIILGFAFQDTMKNIFGGITLSMDQSISKGDVIKLDTGETGEVLETNFRSTKIKTFDNDTLIIPNGLLANIKFHNYAQPTNTIRVNLPIHVAYGSDVKLVRKVLLSCIQNNENILQLPRREVRFMAMGDYSLDFDFIFFISNYHDRLHMIDVVTEKAYHALTEAGISIPFPTRRLYMDSVKEE
jgi:small-conductance mechanosensitive channel